MSIPSALLIAAAAVSLLTSSAPSSAAEPGTAPDLTIQLLSANGSGCPADSPTKVTADVRSGGAITVKYPDFTVSGRDYATCVVVLGVAVPEGWTYAVPSIENLAWLELAGDGSARLQTNAWFTGFSWTVSDDNKVSGPFYNYWETMGTPDEMLWAPCGASFNLNVAETMRVTGSSANSATLISTTVLRPNWRQC